MGVLERQEDDDVDVVGLERARRIHQCGEDSLDLSGHLGSSGACQEAILLVGPVPEACPLSIPHRISIGPGVGLEDGGN